MIYLVVFVCGLLLTLFFVYPVKSLAHAVGAIANPGGRSIHKKPTPLIGGLAIYCAFVLVTGAFLFGQFGAVTQSLQLSNIKLLGLFCGMTFLLLVGILDDIKPMRARTKLIGQLIAASICALFGFNIQAIGLPIIGSVQLGDLGIPIFILWVLAITNAMNLIDGMDGLASTVGFFACIGNGIIALVFGHTFMAFSSFLLAGCLVGFLFHNFPPAKIFLGDTGSMLIGFLLALLAIGSNVQKRSTTILILAPLLLLAFSLLDVLLSIVRRFLRGKPIFSSDMGHIHHRLMAKFQNPRRVLFIVGLFSMFTMLVSVIVVFGRAVHPLIFSAAMIMAGILAVMFVRLLGYFRIDRIKHILDTREEVKFFFALMGYIRSTLPKARTQAELLKELDWVCQALKPHRVLFLDQSDTTIYCYVRPGQEDEDDEVVYKDQIASGDLTIKWTNSTKVDEPNMCDLRLLWRQLFLCFEKEWFRIQEQRSADRLPAVMLPVEPEEPKHSVLETLAEQAHHIPTSDV